MYYVYVLENIKIKELYIGYTGDLKRRINQHQYKKIGFKLIYYEKYHCYQDALSREKFYKMGFGKQIKKVIIQILNKDS